MTLKAVLFDFNGVIFDDEPLHQKLVDQILLAENLRPQPGAYQQLLRGAGALATRLLPQALEVLHRPADEDVVPTADVQRWHVDPRIVLVDTPPTPVVVVAWVIDPVEEVPSRS